MKSTINWVRTSYRNWVVASRNNKMIKLYEKKHYEDIPKLFKNETDYLEIKDDEFPFLFFMIGQGNKQAVSAFVRNVSFKQYLLFDEKNPLKANALHFAYLENQWEIAEELEEIGFNPRLGNSEAQNILHIAAIYRRKDAFLRGLQKKVDFNQADKFGNTPFHYVCRTAETELIKAMIAAKANKVENEMHLYPIHMAIESGEQAPVDLLKTDLWKDYPKFHPIHSAARVGACEIMRELLKKAPSLVNQPDLKKLTPLHHAVATEKVEAIDCLLRQKGILIDQQDEFGNTPLHIAFMRDDLEIPRRLVEAKANLDIQNDDYLAPVDLGLDSTNPQMKNFLRSLVGRSQRLSEWATRY